MHTQAAIGLALAALSLAVVLRWLRREHRGPRKVSRWEGKPLASVLVLLFGAFVAAPAIYLLLREDDRGLAASTSVLIFGVSILMLLIVLPQLRSKRRRGVGRE